MRYLGPDAGLPAHFHHFQHRFFSADPMAQVGGHNAVILGGHLGHVHELLGLGVAARHVVQAERNTPGALFQPGAQERVDPLLLLRRGRPVVGAVHDVLPYGAVPQEDQEV